jgi:hypothetical protein
MLMVKTMGLLYGSVLGHHASTICIFKHMLQASLHLGEILAERTHIPSTRNPSPLLHFPRYLIDMKPEGAELSMEPNHSKTCKLKHHCSCLPLGLSQIVSEDGEHQALTGFQDPGHPSSSTTRWPRILFSLMNYLVHYPETAVEIGQSIHLEITSRA